MSHYLPLSYGTNMVQLYHKKTINIDRKTPNIKTKKGVKPLEFHTFSYGCLLFIYRYLLDFLKSNIYCISISYAYLGTNMGIL